MRGLLQGGEMHSIEKLAQPIGNAKKCGEFNRDAATAVDPDTKDDKSGEFIITELQVLRERSRFDLKDLLRLRTPLASALTPHHRSGNIPWLYPAQMK
jgi:hypothetical protein